MVTYAESGVNIEFGDDASKVLYEASKETWINRKGKLGEVIAPFDDFTGIRCADISELPKGSMMNIGFDGIGTKVQVAQRMGKHDTAAYDLFGMVVEDVDVRGGEAVLVGSILDVNSLSDKKGSRIELVRQLARGYINAAKEANVAVVNGEVAELGASVGGYFRTPEIITRIRQAARYIFTGTLPQNNNFVYNWGAGVVWFAKKERLFTGREIKEGDSIVALKEEGFRSNGLSLTRRILEKEYGRNWHEKDYCGKNLGEMVLEPTKLYTKAIIEMTGGFDGTPKTEVHGTVHVTGGGVPGKLGRVLKPSGLGAIIYELFEPPILMSHLQGIGNVTDEEAYKTWNMGQGKLVITPQPYQVMSIARKQGIEAKIAGQVTKKPGIKIISNGYKTTGNDLIF